MHTPSSSLSPVANAVDAILREARCLHKAVKSARLAASLPVLRRLLASRALAPQPLPELHRQRQNIQRKHVLRMLALEAGFSSWEAYREALAGRDATGLEHFDIARQSAGQLNLWFSSPEQAEQYAHQHGGRVMRVGYQAVILRSA